MRNEEIIEVDVDDFLFQGEVYGLIKVPLNHINFDRRNKKRSDFSVEEVVKIVIRELEGNFLTPTGHKNGIDFFVHILLYEDRPYKLVFEVSEKVLCITVITLFRQKVTKE
jgi:hypothetical protein